VTGASHGPWYFFALCTAVCKELELSHCVQPLVTHRCNQQCWQWSLQAAPPSPGDGDCVPALFSLGIAFEKEEAGMEAGWDGAAIGDFVCFSVSSRLSD